jgi:hypothetical protein
MNENAATTMQGDAEPPIVPTQRGRRGRRAMAVTTVAAAGAIGVIAAVGTANASSTTATHQATASASSSTARPATAPRMSMSSAPVLPGEKSVSAALTAELTAKAEAAVPGGHVFRIETDSGDATYEAHMTTSSGSLVTVKFDAAGAVTKVESGMGVGPNGQSAPSGAPTSGAPSQGQAPSGPPPGATASTGASA